MQPNMLTAIALFFGGASALAVPQCVGQGYGTFYNDHACTSGASVAFSMGNSGCIANQLGRNSVYVQSGCVGTGGPSMVWSPGTNCNCQNDCASVPGQGCWDLQGHKGASSFRFIQQGCARNNC